jgi:hypothetical protein
MKTLLATYPLCSVGTQVSQLRRYLGHPSANSRRVGLTVGLVFVFLGFAGAREKKKEPPSSALTFIVLKEYNGKPLRNAAVVLHPVNAKDKQGSGGLELKTDAEGKASYEGIPYGKLRVQILAHGFQTFGQDYDINQPATEFTVKMKSPAGQYSIYEDHPAGDNGSGEKKPSGNTPPQDPRQP